LKQLFAPLLRGKEAWLIPQKIATEPAALLQELSEKVNVGLNCVPSLWSSMLQLLDSGRASLPPKSLTCLYLGGERLNKELVEKTRITLPHLRIWNLYGPTETTANSSTATISSCDHVTIGRPIANTLIYILDPYLKPVPVGIAGEIHIGGDLLARGYLNRPELTKEKFITNPFVNVPGARLYKTGDLGRYLSDGNIQFLGRIDDQVKIRGFRIELGEIEATLTQHPAVLEAVALVREEVGKIEHGTRMAKNKGENPQSDRQLVTYVVPNPKRSLTPSELRGFLKRNYLITWCLLRLYS